MTAFLKRLFGFETELDRKVQEAVDFTVRNYSKTLKDLARYDRGESISNGRESVSR